ncbi:hypothetical protein [Nonomuraea angiospora]
MSDASELPNGTTVQGVVIVAEDRLARRPGDYERFVEAIMYQDGREFADASGPKDLYSEDTESMGLFGAVISKSHAWRLSGDTATARAAATRNGISSRDECPVRLV